MMSSMCRRCCLEPEQRRLQNGVGISASTVGQCKPSAPRLSELGIVMMKAHCFLSGCRYRSSLRSLIVIVVVSMMMLPRLQAQVTAPAAPAAKTTTGRGQRPAAAPASYALDTLPRRAREYYNIVWGIDALNVRQTESGELIRFSWRIIDPQRAKFLNDKKIEPELIDLQAGVKLVVPQMEFVGPLRESTTPVMGRTSWIAFSNVGRRVKRGDRVTIVVGKFHVDGLLVQ